MHRHAICLTAAVIAAATLTTARPAAASDAITLTQPGDEISGATLTLGFAFSVDRTRTVTALGAFDDLGDGFLFDVPVGIWDADGDLLASTVIAKGSGGELDGSFRFNSIAPLTLTAGAHYVVGAFYAGDFASSLDTGFGGAGVIAPHVHIDGDRFAGSGVFAFPDETSGTPGAWLGGNFRLADGAPEPASWALMIAGFAMAGACLRRGRDVRIRWSSGERPLRRAA
jgi:hypothetical protein